MINIVCDEYDTQFIILNSNSNKTFLPGLYAFVFSVVMFELFAAFRVILILEVH